MNRTSLFLVVKRAFAILLEPILFCFWPVFCRVEFLDFFKVFFLEFLFADVEEFGERNDFMVEEYSRADGAAVLTSAAAAGR